MGDEKFNYWVTFSFIAPEGELRLASRFIERTRPIETHDDIKSLKEEAGFADLRALQPIYWMRME